MTTYSSIYMVRAVDIHGTAYAEFVNATVDNISWVLNDFGGATFSVPTDDPSVAALRDANGWLRECQIWRDPLDGTGPKLIFWGPIVRVTATGALVTCQAMGLLWYFSRLFFGPIISEAIVNGTFDAGMANWTAVNTTASIDTTIVRQGTSALKLVQAATGQDSYMSQTFTGISGPEGFGVYVAAEFYIEESATVAYLGSAFKERGIYVKASVGATVYNEVWTPISNAVAANSWNRIYAPSFVTPQNLGAVTIEVRLYSLGGTIRWDMVTGRQSESTGSNDASLNLYADLNATLAQVVDYAQGQGALWTFPLSNKPNLNIAPPTGVFGVSLERIYQFYDLGNIWDACFKELIGSGVCDIDIVWNATGTTRTLVAYIQKGAIKPQLGLTLGGNVVDFSYDYDGQTTASEVVIIPQYDQTELTIGTVQKPAQYFGYAVNPTANSGITLGAVDTTAIETLPDGVQLRAVAELAQLETLVTIPTLVVKEELPGSIIGVLATGDTIPVNVKYGFVQDDKNYRVTAMTLTPASETLSVVCGVVPLGTGLAASGNGMPATGANNLSPTQAATFEAINANLLNVNRSTIPPPVNFAQVGATNLNYITNAQFPVYSETTGLLTARNPYDIIYNLPGPLSLSTSPAVAPRDPMTVTGFSAQLATPGTTSTTINLLKNGTIVATISMAAGVGYANVAITPAVSYGARGDTYAVNVSHVGAGAADLGGGIEIG